MAGDPSDICGAPVSVFFLQIENILRSEVSPDRVSAGGVNDSLGLPGRTRRIENVERMFGVERLGRTIVGSFGHQLVPPVIASGLQVDGSSGALVHHHVLHRRTGLERLFDRWE